MQATQEKLLQPSRIRLSKKKIYTYLTIGAILSSFATYYFLVYVQIMAAGLAGISNGIAYTLNDILISAGIIEAAARTRWDIMVYWVVYLIANIPIIYLSTRWFSKKFLIYSVYFFTINFISALIFANVGFINEPILAIADEEVAAKGLQTLMYALIGGAIYGIGTGMAFKVGACTMGLDPVSKFISREKDISIAPILFAITIINTTLWTVVRWWTSGDANVEGASFFHDTLLSVRYIASWVFVGTYSVITGFIYSANKKVQVFINSKKATDISNYFNSINYHRGHTLFSVEGGYSKERAKSLLMIINIQEMYDVIEKVAAVDGKAFITIQEMLRVYDVRDWKAMTDDDKEKEQEIIKKEQKRKDRLAARREDKDA